MRKVCIANRNMGQFLFKNNLVFYSVLFNFGHIRRWDQCVVYISYSKYSTWSKKNSTPCRSLPLYSSVFQRTFLKHEMVSLLCRGSLWEMFLIILSIGFGRAACCVIHLGLRPLWITPSFIYLQNSSYPTQPHSILNC